MRNPKYIKCALGNKFQFQEWSKVKVKVKFIVEMLFHLFGFEYHNPDLL